MDVAEIITEIRNRLGEDVEDYWKDSQILRAINQAVIAFSKEERWPWLLTVRTGDTLTTGNTDVSLPTDIDFMRAFNIKLKKGSEEAFVPTRVTPSEGVRLSTQRNSNGRPLYYYVISVAQSAAGPGDETHTYTLRFVPSADGTYAIDYVYLRRPAKLTTAATNAEPDLPEDYHEAIVSWATAQLWLPELQGSQVKSAEQMAMYQESVAKARRDMYKLAEDEELVWGREQDERERRAPVPLLPDTYGERYGWFS